MPLDQNLHQAVTRSRRLFNICMRVFCSSNATILLVYMPIIYISIDSGHLHLYVNFELMVNEYNHTPLSHNRQGQNFYFILKPDRKENAYSNSGRQLYVTDTKINIRSLKFLGINRKTYIHNWSLQPFS